MVAPPRPRRRRLFVTGAGYYLFRVLSGAVTTALPGEPGGPLP